MFGKAKGKRGGKASPDGGQLAKMFKTRGKDVQDEGLKLLHYLLHRV
jgi:hypothetical protein